MFGRHVYEAMAKVSDVLCIILAATKIRFYTQNLPYITIALCHFDLVPSTSLFLAMALSAFTL